MEPMLSTPEPASAAPPPASSLAGRLMNIFAAPGDVFQEVKNTGISNANWLLPAILLILTSWVSAGLVFFATGHPAANERPGGQGH